MTRLFDRLAVAGVGLIGGSLALAAREAGLVGEIVGLGRSEGNLRVALERGIIDRATRDAADAARGAACVVLAVPVGAMAEVLRAMVPTLPPRAIVTDVGSVKASIVRMAGAIVGPARFVGAHPIAGTEEAGAAAARADLFRGARCILTPTAETSAEARARVAELWKGVGARVEEMDAARHDRILAWVSHLPHVLAFSLLGACPEEALPYAGPSFRSATRVAASPAAVWRDVCVANAAPIGAALDGWLEKLGELRAAIEAGDAGALERMFAAAAGRRHHLDEEPL